MRQSILTPISIIGSGTMLIAVLLFQPSAGSRAAPQKDITDYPGPTQTALALANSSANYAYPGTTTTATTLVSTVVTTGTTTVPTWSSTTATPVLTTTVTPTRGGMFATPTSQALPTMPLLSPTPTEAALPTATPDDGTRICFPGETVTITGQGPENAGFLVYFGQRVVSGGSVRRDGTFTVSLTMGSELPGSYPVEVRIRGSRQLLTSIICQVPATTPTPLPDRSGAGEGR